MADRLRLPSFTRNDPVDRRVYLETSPSLHLRYIDYLNPVLSLLPGDSRSGFPGLRQRAVEIPGKISVGNNVCGLRCGRRLIVVVDKRIKIVGNNGDGRLMTNSV